MNGIWQLRLASAGAVMLTAGVCAAAEPVAYRYSFGGANIAGYTGVDVAARYTDANGLGFENGGGAFPVVSGDHVTAEGPFYFSVKVPEGNYQVTVHLGGDAEGTTTVKAELRRLMLEKIHTAAGEKVTRTFAVSVRRAAIVDASGKVMGQTRVKGREVGRGGELNRTPGGEGWSWDEALTLEFSGKAVVRGVEIVRDDSIRIVFLCGDSTVCDQPAEPFNSWGQMITRWFKPDMAVSNLAISGETMPAFLGENRLTKITSQLRPGDYVLVQFGHNDMKSTAADALETYRKNLERFISETKVKGATVVLLTPVSRETFDSAGKITNSFATAGGDFAAAVHEVAKEQNVTLIDLQAISAKLYETLGRGKAQVLFANASEKTHHSDFGSYEIAKCVVQGIVDAKLPLAEHLLPEWKGFDSTKPDAAEAFDVPRDPGAGATPVGN